MGKIDKCDAAFGGEPSGRRCDHLVAILLLVVYILRAGSALPIGEGTELREHGAKIAFVKFARAVLPEADIASLVVEEAHRNIEAGPDAARGKTKGLFPLVDHLED